MTAADGPGELRKAVVKALEFPDDGWYRGILKNDPCGCALSGGETRAVIDGAVRTAADLARTTALRYGSLSPRELAAALRLTVVHTAGEAYGPVLYLGLYEPDIRTITIYDGVIALVRRFIAANGLDDLTPAGEVERTALYHEVFHALEEETPGIYTRSRMLKRRILGIFPYARGLDGACEVGAVHFSKCMAALSFSPCIYERYLLLATGRQPIDFLPSNV